ncbi:hypothetical protein F0A16_00040 [Salinicola corii]|uniref:Uncharacterized protein n=1 Tax=Salinicola corii TaxID=2606937 RepID=A0A640WI48_9GAMM|nr:NlpC/P60 family N-terminal domain-containing protein [Salinicola corii]KAA0020247.1 hypothetical protein F0A16_00040 [Salinicola corii]
MRCAPVLSVSLLAVWLSACSQPSTESQVGDLATDPVRLKAWREQCVRDRQVVGENDCQVVAEAYRRRFFSGQAGSNEYRTLTDLPPIPPSFDGPVSEDGP